jgi:hypothetical protein
MQHIILIPSLIRKDCDKDDIDLLLQTINSIPNSKDYIIYVVIQGSSNGVDVINGLNEPRVNTIYNPQPLGKWGAVCLGVKSIRQERKEENFVMVFMDADKAFAGKDIPQLTEPIVRGFTKHVIGNRDRIGLQTPGINENLRIYVELFFNTLAFIELQSLRYKLIAYDIQCGFHALHGTFVNKLKLDLFPRKYGGEMATFVQSIEMGNRPVSVDIQFVFDTAASFGIETVVDGLLQIHVIQQSSQKARQKAIKITPEIYSHRIKNEHEFKDTLIPFLENENILI